MTPGEQAIWAAAFVASLQRYKGTTEPVRREAVIDANHAVRQARAALADLQRPHIRITIGSIMAEARNMLATMLGVDLNGPYR